MRRRTMLILLAAWLAAGVGAKVLRYLPEQESSATHANAAVEHFLAQAGWQPGARVPLTKAAVYEARLFVKEGCSRPLAIIVLGSADEAASMIALRFGSDVAYLEAGELTASPATSRFFARALMAGGGLLGARVLPILAVVPAPSDDELSCAPPPKRAWAAIG